MPRHSGARSASPRRRDAPDSDEFEREMLEAEGAGAQARLEREHNELLQELRSLIPGATVLLGFLLAISFTSLRGADARGRVYYFTLVSRRRRSFSSSLRRAPPASLSGRGQGSHPAQGEP
jgi:hypothetical protein